MFIKFLRQSIYRNIRLTNCVKLKMNFSYFLTRKTCTLGLILHVLCVYLTFFSRKQKNKIADSRIMRKRDFIFIFYIWMPVLIDRARSDKKYSSTNGFLKVLYFIVPLTFYSSLRLQLIASRAFIY